jgi:hypothetical protein
MHASHSIFTLAIAVLSCVAVAQPVQIGSVKSVGGLVTVSDANTVNSVVPGMAVVDGARFVTSSSGTAVLKVGRDCEVPLKPNQSVIVERDKTCPELLALVQNLSSGAPVVATSNNALQVIGMAAVAALLLGNSGGAPAIGGDGGIGGQTPEPPPPVFITPE